MAEFRAETDSLGSVQVPAERLWGAGTQRALANFQISSERMPPELIGALALVKLAAATVHERLGVMDADVAQAIAQAAREVHAGALADEFPLVIWQTGSGTQTNMNMNEVLANRASELLGGIRGVGRKVHPHDDVNRGHSSNDAFPTAMSIAAVLLIKGQLLPSVRGLRATLAERSASFADVVKIGRTHLQDAVPLTLGQEISGWVAQLDHGLAHIGQSLPHLSELALGGSAVGTGLNAHPEFAVAVAAELSRLTGHPFATAPNKFEALAAHDALIFAHGALKTLAASLMKIANDVRWLASGPRCGIGEITIPENEPGSSIMPGKANPTQCEALTMLCAQVFGNDVAINCGGAMGNFELNVFKPLIAYNFLQSCRLLADGAKSFDTHCAAGIEPDRSRIARLVGDSLMLVTALSPHIGYDSAARIARHAQETRLSLREAALALELVTPAQFDAWVKPGDMVGNVGVNMLQTDEVSTEPGAERSIANLIREYAANGHSHNLMAAPEAHIRCTTCGFTSPASAGHIVAFQRFEGASDPDEMCLVAAVLRTRPDGAECRGVMVLAYGPGADVDEKAVLDAEVFDVHARSREAG